MLMSRERVDSRRMSSPLHVDSGWGEGSWDVWGRRRGLSFTSNASMPTAGEGGMWQLPQQAAAGGRTRRRCFARGHRGLEASGMGKG